MITAVDANIIFDISFPDAIFGLSSKEKLRKASQEGGLIICEAVYAEIASLFHAPKELGHFLEGTGIELKASLPETLWKAGHLWRHARKVSIDEPRIPRRMLADFLIGAHALSQADRLLTRDKDFFRRAFRGLRLVS